MSMKILRMFVTFKGEIYFIDFPPSPYNAPSGYSSELQYMNVYEFSNLSDSDMLNVIKNHTHPIPRSVDYYNITKLEQRSTVHIGQNLFVPHSYCSPRYAGDSDSISYINLLEHVLPYYELNGLEKIKDSLGEYDIYHIDHIINQDNIFILTKDGYFLENLRESIKNHIDKLDLVDKLIK